MPTADKTILKQVLREECLPALARQAAYFSVADVRDWLRQRNITCPPALLREYLSAFMRGGVTTAAHGTGNALSVRARFGARAILSLDAEILP